MKKKIIIISIIALIGVISMIFVGCYPQFKHKEFDNNLARNAKITISDGNDEVRVRDGKENTAVDIDNGDKITVNFDKPTAFNTLVLREKNGKNGKIDKFKIYAVRESGEAEFIYENDYVGSYRLSYLKEQTAKGIIIEVSSSGKTKISELELYNRQSDNKIRVNHYHDDFTKGYFTSRIDDAEYGKTFDVITDITIFGAIKWTKNGALKYVSVTEEEFGQELDALKKIIGTRDVKIYLNLLTYTEDGEDLNKTVKYSVNNHLSDLISNIVKVVDRYGFDGVDFDWEYPNDIFQWGTYGKLLTSLKNSEGFDNKKLSVALPVWGGELSANARDAIDYVNIMTYDDFDSNGNHAAFNSVVRAVEKFTQKGYSADRLCIGLPFYGRPSSAAPHWPRYSDSVIDEWQNYRPMFKYYQHWDDTYPETDSYFNSQAMIRDKTAYAKAIGIAGVMIWAGNYDLPISEPLSLYRGIAEVLGVNL